MLIVRAKLGWLYAALVSIALAACADSAPSKGGSDMGTGGENVPIPVGDMMVSAPPTQPPVGVGTSTLTVEGDANRLLSYNVSAQVKVFYKDAAGAPIPNGRVQAAMIDASNGADVTAAGIGGTTLDTSTQNTAADGSAVFTVRAAGSDATFWVRFNAQNVTPEPPVQVKFNVSANGSGDLVVTVHYTPHNRNGAGGRYTFGNIVEARGWLFSDSCERILELGNPGRLPPAQRPLDPIAPFDGVNNVASASDLGAGATFSVAVQGVNPMGQVLAFGCTSGVSILGGQQTRTDVTLTDLPLQYKGEYQIVSRFDLTDMLTNSGVPGLDIVDQILGVLGALGHIDGSGEGVTELVGLVCNELLHLDASICDIAETAVSTLGADTIEDLIIENVPPQVMTVFGIIGDVYDILSAFTVVGTLEFPSDPVEGVLAARNNWESMQFEWSQGCQMGDPNLCQRTINFGAEGGDPPIEAVIPEAHICDPSQMTRPEGCPAMLTAIHIQIPEHSFTVHYGSILLSVVEQWVVPAIAGMDADADGDGRVTIQEYLNSLGMCDAFGNGRDFCERVLVGAINNLIVNQLGNLGADFNQFLLSGDVLPGDTDADLNVDRLDGGTWTGRVDVGSGTMFRGCFSGCLKKTENNRPVPCPDVMQPCQITAN